MADQGKTDDTAQTDKDAGAPSVETAEVGHDVPRDERCDSIDPATGTLTAEAVAIRRAARDAAD
jgi:hypothetical protein